MSVNRVTRYFRLLFNPENVTGMKSLITTWKQTVVPALSFFIYVTCLITIVRPRSSLADLSSELEQVTGNRTKIVFAKCLAGDGSADLTTPNYSLIGFDTYRNEFFEIVSGPRYCANPIITPDGNGVLFSDLEKKEVNIVPWCGAAPHMLVSGYALCVQRDTVKGTEWVYVSDSAYGSGIRRYNIADTSQSEMIWNKSRVSIRFSVSADGRVAGGEFPWPIVGEVSLPNNEFKQFGSGCNAAIAPDNSYRLFHMDGNHKSIWMYDSNGKVINQIFFNTIPGLEDYSTWIPRWSSDARFMTLTAPCQPEPRTHEADIYFGCFNESHDSITQWISITNTPDTLENYAYAWIGRERYVTLSRYEVDFIHKKTGIYTLNPSITASSLTRSLHDCSISVSDNWLRVKPHIQDGKIILENSIDSTIVLNNTMYSALATVTCPGYAAESYRVNLKVEDAKTPVLLNIVPNNQSIHQYDSLKFSAICLDQFKTPLTADFGWSLSGGGTIRRDGHFVNNGDTGNFTVRVWLLTSPTIIDSTTISIYENPKILVPDSNTIICSSDSLYIHWVSHVTKFKNLLVYLSIDAGRNWKLLNPVSAIYPQYDSSGSFTWALPPSICDLAPGVKNSGVLNKCKIKITDYHDEIRTVSEESFTVKCSCGGNEAIQPVPKNLLNITPPQELTTVAAYTLTGKLVYRTNKDSDHLLLTSLPNGVYILRTSSPHKLLSEKILKW